MLFHFYITSPVLSNTHYSEEYSVINYNYNNKNKSHLKYFFYFLIPVIRVFFSFLM